MDSKPTYLQHFINWVNQLPHEEGFRNDTVVKIVREALGQGFSNFVIEEVLREYCNKSGLSYSEAFTILKNHEKKHAITPFTANFKSKENETDWGEATKEFLKSYFWNDGVYTLVLWNDNFYNYLDGKYHLIEKDEVKAFIGKYILEHNTKLGKKKISVVHQEILAMLCTLILIPKNINPPFFDIGIGKGYLDGSLQSKRNWLALENGIFDIDEYLNDDPRPLMEHTSHFFSFNKLPYLYDPTAQCPTWISFLADIFKCEDTINLIQEWFGYHLAPHCRYEKFLVAYGKGRNGKSVILKVLSLMLGEGNYSSVGIEAFDPQRTFALASLVESMANIINDLNEFKRTGEGLLKQFVSGEPITVERKYKPHFTFTPTAKITIATNHHVKWGDKSDGIWKRMILINFEKQILDEAKQNKNLVDASWWHKSGELSGVLNWALEGLKRLEKRGYFVIPKKVELDVELCRQNANFAYSFLMENIESCEEGQYPSHWLYNDYKDYCIRNGSTPLQANNFSFEVQRFFPNVKSSEPKYTQNPRYYPYGEKVKTRIWHGIRYVDGPIYIPTIPLEHTQKDNPF